MKDLLITFKNQAHEFAKREIKVLLSLLIIVGGTWLFIELADEVSEGDTQKFDEWVLTSLRNPENYEQTRGPKWAREVMRDITALGGGAVIAMITIAVVGFLILQKQYHALYFLLAAIIGGVLIQLGLKELIGRERPTVVHHLVDVSSLSFPSGHSMMSAVVYLTQAVLLARIQAKRLIRIYILSVALFLAFIIGVSRIYLGVHYPTDVIGGWTVGLVWASLCWFAAWYIQKKTRSREMETEKS